MEHKRMMGIKKLRKVLAGSRGRAAGLLGKFLVFMIICTLVSRWLYASRMVQVTAGNSRSMSLNHVVEAEGKVQEGPLSAVLAPAGIRIANVAVKEGQQVAVGDVLLMLDCEDIRMQLEERREELQRLTLQLEAAKANANRQAADAERTRKRAEEDYQDATADGSRQLNEAQEAWERARQERENLPGWDGYLASVQQEDLNLRRMEETIRSLQEELATLQEQMKYAESAEPAQETGTDWTAMLQAKEQELAQAGHEREDYLAQLAKDSYQQWEQQRAALEAAEEQARRDLEGAQETKEQSIRAAARALEDASQAGAADSSLELLAMDVAKAETACAQYEALLADEGKVCSTQDGMVSEVAVRTGERTADSPVFLLAAQDGDLTFRALLTKAQSQYVNVGDSCSVSFDGGKRKVENLTVLSLTESKEQEAMFEMTLSIPAGQAVMGQSGTWRLVQQTRNYSTCIPLEALHIDNRQQTYVLMLQSVRTFLGEELTVVRRPVKVLDQNDTYAALEDGAIGADEQVVLTAAGIINEGDIVRMEEP